MCKSSIPAASCLVCVFFMLSLSFAAPPTDVKSAKTDVTTEDNDATESHELAKRMSGFVRIGRPSGFVRIGRSNSFIRLGRPGNFVRIGRGYGGEEMEDGDLGAVEAADTEAYGPEDDKRASSFVRIGRASNFVRIGKSGLTQEPDNKRMSSFVRIGRPDGSYAGATDSDDFGKRASSFIRIGRIPSSAFVRIGRDPNSSDEGDEYDTFDRIARMGQSSFVRIGKREATKPERLSPTHAQ